MKGTLLHCLHSERLCRHSSLCCNLCDAWCQACCLHCCMPFGHAITALHIDLLLSWPCQCLASNMAACTEACQKMRCIGEVCLRLPSPCLSCWLCKPPGWQMSIWHMSMLHVFDLRSQSQHLLHVQKRHAHLLSEKVLQNISVFVL